MNKRILLSLFVGVVFSAVALYLALRNVPFDQLIDYLGSMNYLWVMPATVVGVISFMLRAVRWQLILGVDRRIGYWRTFHAMMIGFMLNCILPARVGELARAVILKQKERVPFTTGIATVAAERVLDLVFLLLMLAVVLSFVSVDSGKSHTFAGYHLDRDTLINVSRTMVHLCLILVCVILVMSIEKTRALIKRLLALLPGLFSFAGPAFREKVQTRLSDRLIGMVDNFASGFVLVKRPGQMLGCVVLSILVWGSLAFSYYLTAVGAPGIGLTYAEIAAMMVIICFFIALPSAPGFWGLWEAGGVFALSLFGVSAREAAGYTLANHAIQLFPVIVIGLASALITGVNILQVAYRHDRSMT